MHRQRHAVRPVPLRRRAQIPQRILQALTQAREALREAQRYVLPVRVGQHKMVYQVRKRLPLNGDVQAIHVREVRRAQATRLMHLTENTPPWPAPCSGLPLPDSPFHAPPTTLPVLAGVFHPQHFDQRLGLQPCVSLQQFFQTRPHLHQRIHPRTPGARRTTLTGQLASVAVFPCRFCDPYLLSSLLAAAMPSPVKVLTAVPLTCASVTLTTFFHIWQLLLRGSCQCIVTPLAAYLLCSDVQRGWLIVAGGDG